MVARVGQTPRRPMGFWGRLGVMLGLVAAQAIATSIAWGYMSAASNNVERMLGAVARGFLGVLTFVGCASLVGIIGFVLLDILAEGLEVDRQRRIESKERERVAGALSDPKTSGGELSEVKK